MLGGGDPRYGAVLPRLVARYWLITAANIALTNGSQSAFSICSISSPAAVKMAHCATKPTLDEELLKLDSLARQYQVPLLIDNAYGLPFPGLIFTDARPLWNPNIIYYPVHELVQTVNTGSVRRYRHRR